MYEYQTIQLYSPDFASPLTDLIIQLDVLRSRRVAGSTHSKMHLQLKSIFHMLESIYSARIEGNNTTIYDYVESELEHRGTADERLIEIKNMEKALALIDEKIDEGPIGRDFVLDLHQVAVKDLTPAPNGEGDSRPGHYRHGNVRISGSVHVPPPWEDVQWYMEELFDFINRADPPKYDLIKASIAHHRFVWIHPFSNGNGRVVRLLNYALWIKFGFKINEGRIIHPSAMFCSNRQKYYAQLAGADRGTKDGVLGWCEYVLSGLRDEITKMDTLLDYETLQQNILFPAIAISLKQHYITPDEALILRTAIEKTEFKASDIHTLFPDKTNSDISYMLNKLKDKHMIRPTKENGRVYTIHFASSYLLRGMIASLRESGFIPIE